MNRYPEPDEIRDLEAWREEESAVRASQNADPRGSLNYEEVEGGAWDSSEEQADGHKEIAA